MRILCLISALGPGGAERVMVRLVTHLAHRHEVMLMTWEAPDTPSFYPLPESANVVRADLLGPGAGGARRRKVLARFANMRGQIKAFRPDVVLSFVDTMNLYAILSCLGTGVPVVVSERVDPAQHAIGAAKSMARRLLYPLARRCVVQTRRAAEFFDRPPRPRLAVIANPVAGSPAADPAGAGRDGRRRVVAMGRLTHQKGFDRLIAAFALIASRHPDWDLTIFGEGPDRATLEAQLRAAGLVGRVTLPGVTSEPERELAASHIMAFPSRYEGFPNALAEGLAAGLPAVGYRNVSGVEDLIADGETGFLVKEDAAVDGLAAALQRLIEGAELRKQMGARARVHVARWAPERILAEWEAMLEEAASRPVTAA
jgi:glycosyltransferase involved in cell wall biosynthesis